MNLPNILTLLRILMTFVFLVFLNKGDFSSTVVAFVVFVAASLTDFLDGYIAKRYNLISNFGRIMDPIADKFLMLSAFYMFMQMNIIAEWMFYIIFIREILVTLVRFYAMGKGVVMAAEKAGKYKTMFQISTVIVILLYLILYRWAAEASAVMDTVFCVLQKRYLVIAGLMLITVLLTLVSGISTLWRNRKVFL
ncbi:MAG: CDP-diacylglycerol--glycerol-3-phosphate 3-phosphatidyltransferase [Candidatus Omnitrophica bacterium]|nr:CDP-diacylglycerol--glycerol-3-phosphate 3-phosphatidyltransferase [Candidatus Omnitrophota bacterium]